MQAAMMVGSARSELSVSSAGIVSLNETDAFVLSATIRANALALVIRSQRAALMSEAINDPVVSSSAAPLMIMIIATILFGMERLRKEIMVLSRPYDIRHAQQVRTESQRHSFCCIRIDFEPNPVSRLSEPD